MANVIFTQTDTTAECSFNTHCSTQSDTGGTTVASDMRVNGTAGTTEAIAALVNLETRVNAVNFVSPSTTFTVWAAGDYVVRMNITNASSVVTWEDTYICRVNSSCGNLELLGSLTSQAIDISSTGVQTMTVGGSATTAGVFDRVVAVLVFSNSGEHGGDDNFGYTPDQLFDTPIDNGVAEGARRIFIT